MLNERSDENCNLQSSRHTYIVCTSYLIAKNYRNYRNITDTVIFKCCCNRLLESVYSLKDITHFCCYLILRLYIETRL